MPYFMRHVAYEIRPVREAGMSAATRNHETAAGWAYHDATKHSFRSVRDSVHFLDWPNKPLPFKIYTTLDRIEAPRGLPPLDMPALEAIPARRSPI
jgi:hypothetical protein